MRIPLPPGSVGTRRLRRTGHRVRMRPLVDQIAQLGGGQLGPDERGDVAAGTGQVAAGSDCQVDRLRRGEGETIAGPEDVFNCWRFFPPGLGSTGLIPTSTCTHRTFVLQYNWRTLCYVAGELLQNQHQSLPG